MAAFTTIVIKHDATTPASSISARVARSTTHKREALNALARLVMGIVGGSYQGRVSVKVESVTVGDRASATVTITQASLVATTDTLTIGDTTLTWVVASANENQITIGGSDTACGTALAAAINAHSGLKGCVTATSSAGVVTITSALPGRIGELITLAEAGNGQVLSGSALSGVTSTNTALVRDYSCGVA